jgi:hypothetical protein
VDFNTDYSNELYYIEDGKVVFTPYHHIQRGFCCGNGCRHCPYYPKHIKENTNLENKNYDNSSEEI